MASFRNSLARGKDDYQFNPVAEAPRGEATPIRKFQYSKEFVTQW